MGKIFGLCGQYGHLPTNSIMVNLFLTNFRLSSFHPDNLYMLAIEEHIWAVHSSLKVCCHIIQCWDASTSNESHLPISIGYLKTDIVTDW